MGTSIDFDSSKQFSNPESLKAPSPSLKIVKLLEDQEAKLNGKTPLHFAVDYENLEKVAFLVDQGANVNAKDQFGKTPFHYAACSRSRNLEIVKFLEGKGADVHATDEDGRTPLHYALDNENLENAAFLVKQGADVNAKDKNGKTPLHYAVDAENLDFEEWLRKKGNDGAVGRSNLDLVQLLLQKDTSVNVADIEGWTPLHAAARKGYVEVIGALLDQGADTNAKNKDGKTALDIARENEHMLCIDALETVR